MPSWGRPAHAHAMQVLRETICGLPATAATDRLLTKTLQLGEADIDWLLASETMDTSRKMRVLSALVSGSDDYGLGRVFAERTVESGCAPTAIRYCGR